MGGKLHPFWLMPLGAFALTGCIPSVTPPQRSAATPPTRADMAPTDALPADFDFERRSLADVSGGDPAPTWTLKPVVANIRTVEPSVYTVRRGDTLRAIGAMTGAGSEAIALENELSPPFTLFPGQSLRIPGGLFHRVASGETGIGIARAYGVDWGEIVTLNALEEPYILRVGQRLRLPREARPLTPREVDVAARADAFHLDIGDIASGSQPALAARAQPLAASAAPRRPVVGAIASPASFSGPFHWPLNGAVVAKFGKLAPGKINDGINIAVARGTPIRAAADGVVAFAGDQIAVYGGLILIDHGGGWVSAYGHAEEIAVQRGQKVARGDVIGRAGASGQVQSSQLHFQLRKNRLPVDPMKQLPPQ